MGGYLRRFRPRAPHTDAPVAGVNVRFSGRHAYHRIQRQKLRRLHPSHASFGLPGRPVCPLACPSAPLHVWPARLLYHISLARAWGAPAPTHPGLHGAVNHSLGDFGVRVLHACKVAHPCQAAPTPRPRDRPTSTAPARSHSLRMIIRASPKGLAAVPRAPPLKLAAHPPLHRRRAKGHTTHHGRSPRNFVGRHISMRGMRPCQVRSRDRVVRVRYCDSNPEGGAIFLHKSRPESRPDILGPGSPCSGDPA